MSEEKKLCRDCDYFHNRRCGHPEQKGKVVSGKRGFCYLIKGIPKEEAEYIARVNRVKELMKRYGLAIKDLLK